MPFIKPFHDDRPRTASPAVYHNSSTCAIGSAVAKRDRVEGTGGHRQCPECARMNREGK
jgi:hypothetical protein